MSTIEVNFRTETRKVCDILAEVASKAFMSEPVKRWSYSESKSQLASFTEDEKRTVRSYMARYGRVLTYIDYPMTSFFNEEKSRTASLLNMLSHMLDDSGPEYVLDNLKRLEQAADNESAKFQSIDFALSMEAK